MTIKEVVEKWSKESYDKQGYVIGGSDITVLIKSLEEFVEKETTTETDCYERLAFEQIRKRLIGTKEGEKK